MYEGVEVKRPPAGNRTRLIFIIISTLILSTLILIEQTNLFLVRLEEKQIQEANASLEVAWSASLTDPELVSLILPGEDLVWDDVQQSMLSRSLIFDRTALSLYAEPSPPTVVDTTLSPDLRLATVTAHKTYTTNLTLNGTTQITLEHTNFLQNSGGFWVLSEPEADFWGEWESLETERLSLTLPATDVATMQRLIPFLEEEVARICSDLARITCPAGQVLDIQFSTDEDTLLILADELNVRDSEYDLVLPAPSLVGRPIDPAGDQILARGYTVHIGAAIVTKIVGWECNPLLFYEGLHDGRFVCAP